MIDENAYRRYLHTIQSAYRSLGLVEGFDPGALFLPEFEELNQSPDWVGVLTRLADFARSRLAIVDQCLADQIYSEPEIRSVYFHNRQISIPILNQQATEWYGTSSIYNYDFVVETFLGMHQNAETIYDIGAHQGVWSAYYSKIVAEQGGRVYSFEPSIINIECSAILHLINNNVNVVNIPYGIGQQTEILQKDGSDLLIDFVSHNIGLIRLQDIMWEPPDFIKVDIEGFEFELIECFPEIFNLCDQIHLELHIPHLERRNIDYRTVTRHIPFDQTRVLNYQGGQITEISESDELQGFCSLFVTRNGS